MQKLKPTFSFSTPGQHPCDLAWDGRSLWHSDEDAEMIYQINPANGQALKSLYCPSIKTGLAFDGQYLWQVVRNPQRMRCISPQDGTTIREFLIHSGTGNACGIDTSGCLFWLGMEQPNAEIQLRSLDDGRVIKRFPAEPRIAGVCISAEVVWYTEFKQSLLIGIDPETGVEQTRFKLTGNPTGLTWDGRRFWYADYTGKQIRSVQPNI